MQEINEEFSKEFEYSNTLNASFKRIVNDKTGDTDFKTFFHYHI
jgi:hypothetical protein